MNTLTDHDQQLARELIILRTTQKAIEHDKKAMKYRSALKLSDVYIALIEDMQEQIEKRLEALQRAFIRVRKSDPPGVYEVRAGNRQGDILLSYDEIRLEIRKMFERR